MLKLPPNFQFLYTVEGNTTPLCQGKGGFYVKSVAGVLCLASELPDLPSKMRTMRTDSCLYVKLPRLASLATLIDVTKLILFTV